MTVHQLNLLLDALCRNTDPRTGLTYTDRSCLRDPAIRKGLRHLKEILADNGVDNSGPPDRLIREVCHQLRQLGYEPTVEQLSKLLRGSRTVVDGRLRALPHFGHYRGVYTRGEIKEVLADFSSRYPLVLGGRKSAGKAKRPAPEPAVVVGTPSLPSEAEEDWQAVDFFAGAPFNRLSAELTADLIARVAALGLRKPTERLPAYMMRARVRLPRAFEPWTKDERALLIEAMCYTNDAEKLAELFGRSPAAMSREGKRLIWKNRKCKRA